MDFFSMLGLGILGIIIMRKSREQDDEKRRRKNTICKFDDILTEEMFEEIVYKSAKRIKRIDNININNGCVTATVISQSGISEWEFEVDFNDYGKITGSYWKNSDNYDSNIPNTLGDLIQSRINDVYNGNNEQENMIDDCEKAEEDDDDEYNDESSMENNVKEDNNCNSFKYTNQTTDEKKSDVKNFKISFIIIVICYIFVIGLIVALFIHMNNLKKEDMEKRLKGMVTAGSYSDYLKENYETVQRQFEARGFTNIEIVEVKDINPFNNGHVSSISINGNSKFLSSDYFYVSDKVIIEHK